MSSGENKVFMFGLESASLDFVKSNVNRLPTLSRLLNSGRLTHTETTGRHMSGAVWSTFSSASMPGHHGRYYPMQWDPATMRFHRVTGATLETPKFWERIAARGKRVIAFDSDHGTTLAQPPTIEICGWNAQSCVDTVCNDPDLLRDLKARYGSRPMGREVAARKRRRDAERIRDSILHSVHARGEAIRWLMKKRPWDLFICAMHEAHRAGHNLWPLDREYVSSAPDDALIDIYSAIDEELGITLDAIDLDSTTVVVFSLVGMQETMAQNHFLMPALDRINANYATATGRPVKAVRPPGVVRNLRRMIPDTLQYRIASLVGFRVQDFVVNREHVGGRHWPTTFAIAAPTGGEGFVRLNIKGRERDGTLDPGSDDYRHFVDYLREQLLALRVEPEGDPLVKSIVMLQQEYPGPRAQMLPDMLLEWYGGPPATEVSSPDLGTISAHLTTGRGGNHNGKSFSIVLGGSSDDTAPQHIAGYGEYVEALLCDHA